LSIRRINLLLSRKSSPWSSPGIKKLSAGNANFNIIIIREKTRVQNFHETTGLKQKLMGNINTSLDA
jgi:hypothetical protein